VTKETYSFEKLPFSKLFKSYTQEFSALKDFYSVNPFNESEIKTKASLVKKKETHSLYISALKELHTQLDIKQSAQLEKLAKKDSLAIVTGQQLGVYGGPLFTIYKTISAILLAKEWEKKLSKPVVPVFWLADEDHDFEEVTGFGIPGNDEFSKIDYNETSEGEIVSDISITSSIQELKEAIKEEMFDTDFSAELWTMFDSWYKEGVSFRKAFAQMMDELFGKYGLVIVGSNTKENKELVSDTFALSIKEASGISNSLQLQSDKIKNEFQQQVTLGDSNLFYVDDKNRRIKIERDNNNWIAGTTKWSEAELLDQIKSNPERFFQMYFYVL